MKEKKNKKWIKELVGLIIAFSGIITIAYCSWILPDRIEGKVVKEEIREVLDGNYVNIEGNDYILLQIKYDDYSKLEKYLIHDIVFKDIEDVEQPYLKVYLNRYDRVLNSELYY